MSDLTRSRSDSDLPRPEASTSASSKPDGTESLDGSWEFAQPSTWQPDPPHPPTPLRRPKALPHDDRPFLARWLNPKLNWKKVVLAFVILFVLTRFSPRNSSKEVTSTGSINRDVYAAVNEKTLARVRELAIAGDLDGIQRLQLVGLVIGLKAGDRVRVINQGFINSEVKMESGRGAGKYVFVPSDYVNW